MIADSLRRAQPRTTGRGLTLSLNRYWDRISLLAVLLLAAVLDFYGLSREGYSNTYYAAAVKSMMQNWHNFFFASFDPGGFVSIDKPPLGFWLQVDSVKIFGYSGVALMLPQALAGVCSVALLYHLVNRTFGRWAGLIAALALAITPISVVANRNNIVDSTLVLAVLLGAWAVTRAVESGRLRWLLLCAVFVGLGFNIKMLQAYLVLPAFGLMYLVEARTSWGKRIVHLVLAGIVLLVVSLSWVTVVDLTPAGQRPWVGSTTDNSELSLAIGYNGLQRLTGNSSVGGVSRQMTSSTALSGSSATAGSSRPTVNTNPGGSGGGPGGVGENGPTGVLRLLDSQLGAQIGWLLPMSVLGVFAAFWQTRRRRPLERHWSRRSRTLHQLAAILPSAALSGQQSALVMWGTWLFTMAAFFSIAGFFHTYYLVMVAPAISALSGIGILALWKMYQQSGSRTWPFLSLGMLAAAGVEVHILSDYPVWSRWLAPLTVGLAITAGLIFTFARVRPRLGARLMMPAMLLGVAGLLVAPAVWSVESVSAADSGLTPRAGPSGTSSTGGGGQPGSFAASSRSFQPPAGSRPGAPPNRGSFQSPTGMSRATGNGGPGGDQVDKALLRYLEQHQGTAKYLFATTNAGAAEPYIIATGKPVMALGGFTGSDPILTSSELAKLVKQGAVRYFLLGGGGGPGGGNSSATPWVQSKCTVVSASQYSASSTTGSATGSQTVYDCGAVK
jgi:4-amino-4-deoxy-L-arabinose transferase-like glycosyltransferase